MLTTRKIMSHLKIRSALEIMSLKRDKPETSKKANYVQVVTGYRIVKTDGTEWLKFESK